MNNTDILSQLLEISEKHFDENNYLKVAKMLKDVHEKKQTSSIGEFKRFKCPVIVKADTEKFDNNIIWSNFSDTITFVGYKPSHGFNKFIYSQNGYRGDDPENYKEISVNKCKDFLKILLKIDRTLMVNIESFITDNNPNTTYYFADYKEHLIEMEKNEELGDYDYNYDNDITNEFALDSYYDSTASLIHSILLLSCN